jgi:hypothetical protein
MREAKDDLKKRLEKLQREGLLDPEDVKKCDCEGDCDLEGLAQYLQDNKDGSSLEEMLSKCQRPGKGGVNEGPGTAGIQFGKESDESGVKFKEQSLPAARLRALKESKLTGVSTTEPKKGDGGPAGSGALADAAAGGGSANNPVVLPRHRGAVERYFERKGK